MDRGETVDLFRGPQLPDAEILWKQLRNSLLELCPNLETETERDVEHAGEINKLIFLIVGKVREYYDLLVKKVNSGDTVMDIDQADGVELRAMIEENFEGGFDLVKILLSKMSGADFCAFGLFVGFQYRYFPQGTTSFGFDDFQKLLTSEANRRISEVHGLVLETRGTNQSFDENNFTTFHGFSGWNIKRTGDVVERGPYLRFVFHEEDLGAVSLICDISSEFDCCYLADFNLEPWRE